MHLRLLKIGCVVILLKSLALLNVCLYQKCLANLKSVITSISFNTTTKTCCISLKSFFSSV